MTQMDGQSNLMDFGIPTISEKALTLIKKISKLTNEPTSTFNQMSEEELEEVLQSKTSELAEIKALSKKLEKHSLEFDESKTVEENQELLEAAEYRAKNPAYKFPFRIYFKGNDIQEPDHIFNIDQEYSDKEIIKLMFKAGYKEFSGEIKINYDASDNMIIPEFTSQRHG